MLYHNVSIQLFKMVSNLISNHQLVGGTQFSLGGTTISITSKDGIGKLIEEWLGIWAVQQGIEISPNKGCQSFPDFYINSDNSYLEIKAFDLDASANFDIANFESYCESLSYNPHRLYADYFILGYRLIGSKLIIENVWLKKIWEISCSSERFPLKVQAKRDVIYNIRPAVWYSNRARYPVFYNDQQFVDALYATQKQYLKTTISADEQRFYKNINK